MANINDRIGSQNVIRVLSNASAPPSRLINLVDVDSTFTNDGVLLVWDLPTNKFIMTSVIDAEVLISDNSPSISTSTGALQIVGGVGIGENLNIGGDVNIVGILTVGSSSIIFDGDNNNIKVGTGVTIDSDGGIDSPSIRIGQLLDTTDLTVTGLTTLGSTENTGITTVLGDFYVGQNVQVAGASTFIGSVTFKGGTINLGDENTDDINVSGEFVSNLVPDETENYLLGSNLQRWLNTYTKDLSVSGISTFTGRLNANGDIYYDDGYNGPNGIVYFDDQGKLSGAGSTETAITDSTDQSSYTSFVLTTNAQGIPAWAAELDGGSY